MKKPAVVYVEAHRPTAPEGLVQAPAAGLDDEGGMLGILHGMVKLLRRAVAVDNRVRQWETPADVVTNREVIRQLYEVAEALLNDVVRAQNAGQRSVISPTELSDGRTTVADATELDNWLLYRARSWQHGQDLKNRRRRKNAGETL